METEAGKNILSQINDLMKTAKTPSIHKPKAEVVSLSSVSTQRRGTCDAFNKRFTQLAIDMYPTCTKTERAEKIAKKVIKDKEDKSMVDIINQETIKLKYQIAYFELF